MSKLKNCRIVHVGEIILYKEDFDKFHPVIRNAILTFASIGNELNVFSRLLLLSMTTRPGDPLLLSAAYVQESVISRTLSSKVYEGLNALDKFRTAAKVQKVEMRDRIASCFKEADDLKKDWFYKLTARSRNKITFHYDVSPAQSGYEALRDGKRLTFVESSNFLTSFYPAAEETIFLEYFQKLLLEDFNRELTADDRHAWVMWNVRASMTLQKSFQSIFSAALREHHSDKKFKRRHLHLEPEYSTAEGSTSLPIEVDKASFKPPEV